MIDIKSNKSNQNTLLAIAQAILIVGSATMSSSFLIAPVNAQVNPDGDDDGDGLKNSWETTGIPYTGVDGQQHFYQLPQANPNHKNLYVEVDYMNGHRPNGGSTVFGAIEDVRRAFRLAPVSNPDGNPGVTLFVQLDDNITHADTTDLAGLKSNIKPTWFGTATERADPNSANLLAAKRMAFHYGVFAHDQPGVFSGSSGVADLLGMDFLVTLGKQGWAIDSTGHSVGSRAEQAATFMHELGHNLGLRHGGNEDINCKPNYLSVMNYLFQFPDLVASRPLDFSRSALDSLNKASLIEANGISQSNPENLTTIYGPVGPMKGPVFTTAGVPIDWNFNGVSTDRSVSSEIDRGLDNNCFLSQTGATLTGFNDWNSITYVVSPQQALVAKPALETPNEENITEVEQSRMILVEGIDNAIQRLVVSNPDAMMHKPKEMFSTAHIAQLLKTEQLEAAIAELNKLQAKVIAVFGHEAANKEVVPQIQNLISALKLQEPSPESTPPNNPPPHQSHNKFKDRLNEALDRHIALGGAHGKVAQKIKDRLDGESGGSGHPHH